MQAGGDRTVINGKLTEEVKQAREAIERLEPKVRRGRWINFALVIVVITQAVIASIVYNNYQSDREESCDDAVNLRLEQENLLAGLAVELGAEQEVLESIHHYYDTLPIPAPCE